MASESSTLPVSHKLYKTRYLGGNYAEIGKALGGEGQRVEDPEKIAEAIDRAKKNNSAGRSVLLEFITKEEIEVSDMGAIQGL